MNIGWVVDKAQEESLYDKGLKSYFKEEGLSNTLYFNTNKDVSVDFLNCFDKSFPLVEIGTQLKDDHNDVLFYVSNDEYTYSQVKDVFEGGVICFKDFLNLVHTKNSKVSLKFIKDQYSLRKISEIKLSKYNGMLENKRIYSFIEEIKSHPSLIENIDSIFVDKKNKRVGDPIEFVLIPKRSSDLNLVKDLAEKISAKEDVTALVHDSYSVISKKRTLFDYNFLHSFHLLHGEVPHKLQDLEHDWINEKQKNRLVEEICSLIRKCLDNPQLFRKLTNSLGDLFLLQTREYHWSNLERKRRIDCSCLTEAFKSNYLSKNDISIDLLLLRSSLERLSLKFHLEVENFIKTVFQS